MPSTTPPIPSQVFLSVSNAGAAMYLFALLLVLGLLVRLPQQGASRVMVRFWLAAFLIEFVSRGVDLYMNLGLDNLVPQLKYSMGVAPYVEYVREVLVWLVMVYLSLGAVAAAEWRVRPRVHRGLVLASIILPFTLMRVGWEVRAGVDSLGVGAVLILSALLVSRAARGTRERGMVFLGIAMLLYAIPHLLPDLLQVLDPAMPRRMRQIKNMIEPFALAVTVLLLGGATILLVLQDSVLRVGRLREDHLREVGASEAKLHGIIEAAGEAILTFTPEKSIELANEAAARLFRVPAAGLMGRRVDDLVTLDVGDWAEALGPVTTGSVPQVTLAGTGHRPDDAAFPLECTIGGLVDGGSGSGGGVAILRDMSQRLAAEAERERFERRIADSEKMLAIGRVVSGVAHELNNPLAVVLGQSEQLVASDSDAELREGMRLINEQAHRARHIVRDLLAFVRHRQDHREAVDLGELVERVVAAQRRDAEASGVELSIKPASDVPVAMADRLAVEQVLVNLIDNAIDAVGQEGRVTVGFGAHAGIVELVVEDNGPGVPEGLEVRIFEPFFTTKPAGEGTGLGLSVSTGLLEQLGGSLGLENRPQDGVGARFTVRLPGAVDDAPPVPAAPSGESPVPTLPSGRPGTVLVIDDESSVRTTLARIFRRWGWGVVEESNGSSALALLASRDVSLPDLVLCDLRMPVMTGEAFYTALESTRPELRRRVVFVTGDVVAPETARFLATAGRPVVEKPFTIAEISQIVTEVLASG